MVVVLFVLVIIIVALNKLLAPETFPALVPAPAVTITPYESFNLKTQGSESSIVFQGEEGEQYDFIAPETVQVSSDGKNIAYVAFRGSPSSPFSPSSPPSPFLPSPAKLSEEILVGNSQGQPTSQPALEQFVVVNNEETQIYPIVDIFHLALSSNSEDFGFIASVLDVDAVKYVSAFNGKQSTPYDDILGKNFIFSPDGKKIAYIAQNGGKYFMVAQGFSGFKEGAKKDLPINSSFRFLADGKSLIYQFGSNDQEEVFRFED